MIPVVKYPAKETWSALLQRPQMDMQKMAQIVQPILHDVQTNGDEALKKYSLQFDKVSLQNLQVSDAEIANAANEVSDELKKAIAMAMANIRKFHEAQKENFEPVQIAEGIQCWRKSVAIEKVGLYIPGGTAPLFSTLLMLAIPATIAGCKEIVLCTPCGKEGKVHPAVLYAAAAIGITKIFSVGGAQAIAAMAFGTESIPQVSKIFGPGNQYVTAAKMLVNATGVAIDMPAGPSEVAILADETCVPAFVAADLLSQAEHGADSQVILVSDRANVIEKVLAFVAEQIEQLPRKEMAKQALQNGKAILVNNLQEGMDLLNAYAAEHLIISCANAEELADHVVNAGSVFIGNYSPESAGDYASGTNHTLPTNGYAKAYSGVSLDSFFKKITFQQITKEGIQHLGETVMQMAKAEGLDAHANAMQVRLNS
jgi:histidinol dehydrogenase